MLLGLILEVQERQVEKLGELGSAARTALSSFDDRGMEAIRTRTFASRHGSVHEADLEEGHAREEALEAGLRAGNAPPLRLRVVRVRLHHAEVLVAFHAGVPARRLGFLMPSMCLLLTVSGSGSTTRKSLLRFTLGFLRAKTGSTSHRM